MHFDLNILSKHAKIVGNLPYNLATHFIKNFIEQDIFFMIFTIQTEVAKRICAKLNTKSYGYLSVLSQIFFDCKCHFDISGKNFFPQPKVSSTVISLSPKNFRLQKNVLLFLKKILHAAFSQRRKILSNS